MSDSGKGQPPSIAIRIDRLRIRLNGVDEASARDALAGLGPELARQLTAEETVLNGIGGVKTGSITVPALRQDRVDPGSIRTATARAVAGAILSSSDSKRGTP